MAIKLITSVNEETLEVSYQSNQSEIEHLKILNVGQDKAELEVEPIDQREFSNKQRNLFFALLNDIDLYTGQGVDVLKDYFYNRYFVKTYGCEISLSNNSGTSISEANLLIEITIEFIFEFNIPINEAYELLPKNEAYYLYLCCKYRECIVCGQHADIHHVDAIGMGSNRRKENHLKHHFMALCRKHHGEIEQIGREAFAEKYHVPAHGIKLDYETLKELNIQGDYEEEKGA